MSKLYIASYRLSKLRSCMVLITAIIILNTTNNTLTALLECMDLFNKTKFDYLGAYYFKERYSRFVPIMPAFCLLFCIPKYFPAKSTNNCDCDNDYYYYYYLALLV